MPPEILPTYPEPGATVVIGPAGQAVHVIAVDPDDDDIAFLWQLSGGEYLGNATPLNVERGEGSEVRLAYDAALDGQILYCYVDDGVTDGITLEWHLEVL